MQATSSTPFAFSASILSTKPGRWRAEQVGVKAPGTEKSATLRPLKKLSLSIAWGPSGLALTRLTLGRRSPTPIAMFHSS